MKHRVAGRKLGRTSAHRLALLRNLSKELFDKERLHTTLGKAKELRPFAERLVTLSKRETLHARRQVLRHIRDKQVVAKLFDTISARFAQRPGGYTRIIKLGPRRGDSAEMALIELVGAEAAAAEKEAPARVEAKPTRRKAAAKAPAAASAKKGKAKGATEEADKAGKSDRKPTRKAKPKTSAAEKTGKAKPAKKSDSKGKTRGKTSTPRKAGGS